MTSLRHRLNAGEKLVGLFAGLGAPAAIEIAGAAGFDFLCIDAEHSQLDRGAIEELVRAADASGTPAMVRIAGHGSDLIAGALDAGAAGVLVPRVGTAAEATAIARSFRYPPVGERGVGPGRASKYGYEIGPYLARANETLLLAIQVETAQAVTNLDAILAVEGIDLVFIGPGDLSVSLNLFGPENAAKLAPVIESIVAKAVAARRAVGMFRFSPDDVGAWAKRGASLFIVSSDAVSLTAGVRSLASASLKQLGRGVIAMPLVVKTDGVLGVGPEQLAYFDGMGIEFVERTCLTEPEMIATCAEADALMVLREPVNPRVIPHLKRCKVIGRFGVGLDTIDVPACTAAGIRVTYVPDSNYQEVSSHALAMMLALVRRLPLYDRTMRRGAWDSIKYGAGMRRLDRLTLGIVGFGRVGRDLAPKAKALGFTVVIHDPLAPGGAIEAAGFRAVTLAAMISEVDILSIHVPLSPATANMIDAKTIAAMKPGAILINVSRGGLVDEAALAKAITEGHLAGAGIDTFAPEPPPADHPLLKLDNVIATPHAAHYSIQSYDEVRNKVFADVVAVLRGQEPRYPVNILGAK